MKINRNNCEAFFLDYYEGTLSEQQIAELFSFLKENPDLRDVFESFNDIELQTENERTPDFSFLKKEVSADEHEQAAMWMTERVDGVISEENDQALAVYLGKYPERKADLELYFKTKLSEDADVSFPSTELLRKPVVITAENFDDFAVALIENRISEHDKSLLELFVKAHPEFRAQLDVYRKTILPIETEACDFKSELKKSPLVIGAHNIDELLVSYLDNQLTVNECAQLEQFLKTEPQYVSLLNQYRDTFLASDNEVIFEGKDALRKGAVMVTPDNAEELIIAASEGLLNREELAALNTFVNVHPSYCKLIEQYAQTRLQPDLSVVFEDKEGLKRKDRGGFIWWTPALRYAAILVVLLIGGYFVMSTVLTDDDSGISNEFANKGNNSNNNTPFQPIEKNDLNPAQSNDQLAAVDINSFPKKVSHSASVSGSDTVPGPKLMNPPAPETEFVPVAIAVNAIDNHGNAEVGFSDALYSALFSAPTQSAVAKKDYISPGQLAMRWMKDKLDAPSMQPNADSDPDAIAFNSSAKEEDPNVDGLDLTESAVDRVGAVAANGNVNMEQREDGTWLQLWSYNVRVGR
jgi:hypothetical protein